MRKIYLVVIAVLAIMIFSGGGGNKKSPENKIEDLGITVEEFQAQYNQNALEKNLPQMQITNFEFGTDKSSDTFGYKFVDTFYLWGKVNPKTGKIKSLSVTKALVLNGNDRKAEMQAAAGAFLIMVKTLSPELTAERRAAIIDKFSESDKPYVAVTEGNIKYNQAFMDNGKVLMLSADVKDKK